jgi:putative FmdB family regulatory protein
MAIYEYLCPNCKNEFELTRPMKDAGKPAKCPKCHARARKLASVFGSTPAGGYGIKAPDKGAYRGKAR